MLHVFLLLVGALAYTTQELDKGEACMRLTMLYSSHGDDQMHRIMTSREDLDRKQLEDRLMMDMFNFCVRNVDYRDVFDIEKANTHNDLERFSKYLYLNEEKYKNKEVSVKLTSEELAFRSAALTPRPKSRLAHEETTREAMRFAEKIRREREAAQGLL